MLKKLLVFASISTLAFAEYKPWNFTMLEASLVKGYNNANGFGEVDKDVLFEIQGFTRHNLLDLYWFVDRLNIFNDSDLSTKTDSDPNYVYGEISPRLSLDGITGKDLSVGPVSEWFLATQFDFDNVRGTAWGKNQGLKKYYVGIGNYINMPSYKYLKFDYFRTNLMARYVDRNYGRSEGEWDGYLLNFAYGGTIHKFDNGMKVGFSGWLDYDFGADTHVDSFNKETSDSFQWQNQLRLYFNENVSISYTYKMNNHFSQVNQNTSNENAKSIGLHYAIMF